MQLHVVAAVLQNGNRFFVQQRPPGKHMAGFWEFPGGKVENEESTWDALVRELQEELDITATRGAPLITLTHEYPDRTIVLDVWHVSQWRNVPIAQEQQNIAWHTLPELSLVSMLPADQPVLDAMQMLA